MKLRLIYYERQLYSGNDIVVRNYSHYNIMTKTNIVLVAITNLFISMPVDWQIDILYLVILVMASMWNFLSLFYNTLEFGGPLF